MKEEDKKLLFKDLCARLPYGVKVTFKASPSWGDTKLNSHHLSSTYNIEYLGMRPYLRSMSNMTEEEENEYNSLNAYEDGFFPHTEEAFDWLNKKMFDYRGLILMGLGLEAPKEMYKEN